MLELVWEGACITVMHGDYTRSGDEVSWMAKPSEILECFADRASALTIVAHTHYPFVAEKEGSQVANCGATSGLLLGMKHEDGSISPWGDEPVFTPPAEIYSTFLSVTAERGGLQVTIERFDYDRAKAIRGLREAGHPHVEYKKRWLETGIVLSYKI